MNAIKLPVTATSSGIFVDAEGKWVQSDDVAAALNAAPTRAFGELSGALWGIYKAAADAAETVAGDPGGFSTSADWDYYERRLVDELEERLQAFAAPQVPPVAGWIVANSDKTRFRMWGDFGPEWTDDRDKALHFARKQDAEAFCRDDEDAWAILPGALEAPKPTLAEVILETADRVGNSPFWHAVRTALERAKRAKLVAAMAANPGAKTLQDMVSPGDAAWVATFAAELSKLDAPAAPEVQGGGE